MFDMYPFLFKGGTVSFDNNSVKKYPKAFYPQLEDYTARVSPQQEREEPVPVAQYEYSFELSCSVESLKKHNNCEFSLGMTKAEGKLMNWQIKPVEQGYRFTIAVMEDEPKFLAVSRAGSSLGVTFTEPVTVQPAGADIAKEAFIAVMPAIEVEGLLGHPSQGYFYHFCDGKLMQEYQILGEKRWGFCATHSNHTQLKDELYQGASSAILLPWKRDGALLTEQYLIYLRNRITRKQLDNLSEAWLLEHGVKIDIDAVLEAINIPVVERPPSDNQPELVQETSIHRVLRDSTTGQRETWPEIAKQYGLTARELLDLNPLYAENPLMLDVGHILVVQSADAALAAKPSRELPPDSPQTYNQALNTHYSYVGQCIQDTTFIPMRSGSLVKDIPVVRLKNVPVPVFAKSCLVAEKSTEAGTSSEPISNFGPFSWFFSSAHANPIGGILQAQQATQAALTASGGGATASSAGDCTPCSANKDAAAALTRLAGKLDSALDEYRLFASGSIVSVFLMHRKIWHSDDTQYSEEELHHLESVQSRIRISLTDPAPGEQYPTVQAWHMNFASIPVLQVDWHKSNNSYSVALEKDGPHLTWLPRETGNPEWQLTPGHEDGLEKEDIHTTPIPDVRFPAVETYPAAEEADWSDFVLVFPARSGIAPIYLVYKKATSLKVKVLEVGTYGELSPKSVKDGLDIDHIPSKAALIRAAEKLLGRSLSKEEKTEIVKSAAAVAIPNEIHRKCSETYGGRNQAKKQIEDADDLEQAVNSNFDAIKTCLSEQGYSKEELEKARNELHTINKRNGWY